MSRNSEIEPILDPMDEDTKPPEIWDDVDALRAMAEQPPTLFPGVNDGGGRSAASAEIQPAGPASTSEPNLLPGTANASAFKLSTLGCALDRHHSPQPTRESVIYILPPIRRRTFFQLSWTPLPSPLLTLRVYVASAVYFAHRYISACVARVLLISPSLTTVVPMSVTISPLRLPYCSHCPETIVFAVDLDAEMDEEVKAGSGVTRMAAAKAALRLFVQAKGNAAPRHRFALVGLRDRAEWRARVAVAPGVFSRGAPRCFLPRALRALPAWGVSSCSLSICVFLER